MRNLWITLVLSTLMMTGILHAALVNPAPAPANANSTTAQKQAWMAYLVGQRSTSGYTNLLQTITFNFNQVWNSPIGLAPADAEAGLGTNACAAHMLFLASGQILNAAAPGSFNLTEPCTVTCNQDGTVSLSSCPTPSPSSTPSS